MQSAYDKIAAGLEDAIAYMAGDDTRGRVAFSPARAARAATGLSQEDFAAAYRLPLSVLQDWEAGRRMPDAGAVNFLRMIAHAPEAVRDLLAALD